MEKKDDLTSVLTAYKNSGAARFHMPGSKGREPVNPAFDVTELSFTDDLCRPRNGGIIQRLEENLKNIFLGEKPEYKTKISVGGATLLIQSVLLMLKRRGGTAKNFLICERGSHVSLVNALALSGLEPLWVYPGEDFARKITDFAENTPGNGKIAGIFVTSFDYYGNMADMGAISACAKKYSIPLAADNSHGAHLAFYRGGTLHPVNLNAALCVDSVHKTLPAPTGTAILHYRADIASESEILSAMRVFASTSPSYLLLSRIDSLARRLEPESFFTAGAGGGEHKKLLKRIFALRDALGERNADIIQESDDPFRIVLKSRTDGAALEKFLAERNVIGEFSDKRRVILIPSVNNTAGDFDALRSALLEYCAAYPAAKFAPEPVPENRVITPAEQKIPLSEAARTAWTESAAETCAGCVCAEPLYLYPPGIPIILPGELISEKAAAVISEITPVVKILRL